MNLRDQLDLDTRRTETDIAKTLQAFHDRTGMIPRHVAFVAIDSLAHDSVNRTEVQIVQVKLEATT